MDTEKIEKIVRIKELMNKRYEQGNPTIRDEEYDLILDKIQELDPENPTLDKVGFSVSSKTKLPVPMGSLVKIKSDKELQNWIVDDDQYILTPKLDGISILTVYDADGKLSSVYTRGTGFEGRKLSVIPKCIPKELPLEECKLIMDSSKEKKLLIRGEMIIKKEIFESKYKLQGFRNARNLVASIFNRKETASDLLDDIDYVVYEIVSPEMSKIKQLETLDKFFGLFRIPYIIIRKNNVNVKNLETYLGVFKYDTKYDLDGIVIDIDDLKKRKELGFQGTSINPAYTRAYKVRSSDNEFITEVKSIQWNVSRNGYLKPKVEVNQVVIQGCTITYLTGKNAKYIKDHKISPGSTILITRSGDTIPDILKNLSENEDNPELPTTCPSCGNTVSWNSTEVELVCTNTECRQKKIKQLSYFFINLGVFGLSENRITKFYDSGIDTIKKILSVTVEDISRIKGFAVNSANNIVKAIKNACQNTSITKIMVCTGFFEKLAEKKIQSILDVISFEDLISMNLETTYEKVLNIKGFSSITAMLFIVGLKKFFPWFEIHKIYFNIREKEQKTYNKENDPKNLINTVFTGFRSKDLQEQAEKLGYKIQSGISKKTNLLVCKDVNSNSSKIKQAKKNNIKIISKEKFEESLK